MVWLPNWVGDVVMATPTLGALRRQWPAAHITYVGRGVAMAEVETCETPETLAAGRMGIRMMGLSPLPRI